MLNKSNNARPTYANLLDILKTKQSILYNKTKKSLHDLSLSSSRSLTHPFSAIMSVSRNHFPSHTSALILIHRIPSSI